MSARSSYDVHETDEVLSIYKSLRDWPHRKVFLTGATGLIGGRLLHELLNLPQVEKVVCLVRPTDSQSGAERLERRMKRSGLKGDVLTKCMKRVHAADGSLTEKLWGLSEADLAWVHNECDLFIHCAASTSFVDTKSCEMLNVQGTRFMLDIVRPAKNIKRLVHFSTATVYGYRPNNVVKEEDSLKNGGTHVVAYTRTKAESERILLAAEDELPPLLVVRPSITLAQGTRDRKQAKLFLWSFIAMAQLPYVPINLDALTDVVTLDFVVHSTMRLIARSDKLKYKCYHLTSGKEGAVSGHEVYQLALATTTRPELPQVVPPEEWDESHQQAIAEQGLSTLYEALGLYLPYLNLNLVYDNSRLVEELGEDLPPLARFTDYMSDMFATIDPDLVTIAAGDSFGL